MNTTWTASATLGGGGYIETAETPWDTINLIRPTPPNPNLDFTFGLRSVDGSDTVFDSSTVTFATTSVLGSFVGMLVEVFDAYGVLRTGTIISVDTANRIVTVDRWQDESGNTTTPQNGSRTLISEVGAYWSFSVGTTVYATQARTYGTNVPITFTALDYFPYASHRFAVDYTWNFGDGTIARGHNVVHTYKVASQYRVVLRILDDDGEIWTVGKPIYLFQSNGPTVVAPNIVVSTF